MISDSDKEAFEKFFTEAKTIQFEDFHYNSWDDIFEDGFRFGWQAATEYSNQQHLNGNVLKSYNEKYEAEKDKSRKLVEVLEYILKYKSDEYLSMSRGSIFDVARQALVDYKKEE